MVSFRLATAILVLPFAAAPVAAEGLGSWSKSDGLDVKMTPNAPKSPVLGDLPGPPPAGPQSLPNRGAKMSLQRGTDRGDTGEDSHGLWQINRSPRQQSGGNDRRFFKSRSGHLLIPSDGKKGPSLRK